MSSTFKSEKGGAIWSVRSFALSMALLTFLSCEAQGASGWTADTSAAPCPLTAAQDVSFPNAVESIVGFGDSIMVGHGVSEHQRWLQRVAAALGGAHVANKGRSGTVLQNSPDATGMPRRGNGLKRFSAALTGKNAAEMAIIAYGFNDARYVANPAQFNVASYTRDYRTLIRGLIDAGYRRDRIIVVSPYYIEDEGLQRGSEGFRGQTRDGFEAYVTASKCVADEFGVYWADAYAAMKSAAQGGETLIGRDKLHPNRRGHEIIAKAVLEATRRP